VNGAGRPVHSSGVSGIGWVWRWAGDVLLPQHCCVCTSPALLWLCDECRREFDKATAEPLCPVCSSPLGYADAPCPRCLGREGRAIARVAALARHDGALRDLVHALKYRGRWGLARHLAGHMLRRAAVKRLAESSDMIVPVPLHWWRRLSRGYNQAELLARELAGLTGLELCQALRRRTPTQWQTRLKSIAARARNVRGAFAPTRHAGRIVGRRILLIDDVMTTQATLRAAARALKPMQPASVSALVVTIADPGRRGFTTIGESL